MVELGWTSVFLMRFPDTQINCVSGVYILILILFAFFSLAEFIDDIELMFSNCFEYNPRNTSEAKAGSRLQAFFHIQAQKLGLHVPTSNVDQVSITPVAKKSRI
jgi:hypothetical protein